MFEQLVIAQRRGGHEDLRCSGAANFFCAVLR